MVAALPICKIVLLCDFVSFDPQSGKPYIMGIFDRISVSEIPTNHRFLTIYVKLTDVEGHYRIRVDFVNQATQQVLGSQELPRPIQMTDPISGYNLVIQMVGLSIPAEGEYAFQIFANGSYLGDTPFHVRRLGGGGRE